PTGTCQERRSPACCWSRKLLVVSVTTRYRVRHLTIRQFGCCQRSRPLPRLRTRVQPRSPCSKVHVRIALLTHSRKQRLFLICSMLGRSFSKVAQRGFKCSASLFGQRAIDDRRNSFKSSEEHFNATVTVR